ncbi:MAG: hypothetical protein M3O70_23230 [Actinomycetota bacterium]|nr:hypothetical protein [Actinomycetota bacterium]
MGIRSGQAVREEDDYQGTAVKRCAPVVPGVEVGASAHATGRSQPGPRQ